jgi:hypothetical protein
LKHHEFLINQGQVSTKNKEKLALEMQQRIVEGCSFKPMLDKSSTNFVDGGVNKFSTGPPPQYIETTVVTTEYKVKQGAGGSTTTQEKISSAPPKSKLVQKGQIES